LCRIVRSTRGKSSPVTRYYSYALGGGLQIGSFWACNGKGNFLLH
jgi:hypothetical protein